MKANSKETDFNKGSVYKDMKGDLSDLSYTEENFESDSSSSSHLSSFSNQDLPSLPKPTALLSEAWKLYKSRFKTFLGVVILPVLFVLLVFKIYEMLFEYYYDISVGSRIVFLLVLILGMAFVQFWSQIALIFAIKDDEDIGIKESYRRGWRKIGSFVWVSILTMFIVIGSGVFFVILGIIFAVWFAFTFFIVAGEDLKGMDAVLKSREYVRGYWWQVFWRFLFLYVIMVGGMLVVFGVGLLAKFVVSLVMFPAEESMLGKFIASLTSLASNFVFSAVIPLAMSYLFVTYRHLKKVKSGLELKPSAKEKKLFIAVGALGGLVMVLIVGGSLFTFSALLSNVRSRQMDLIRSLDLDNIKTSLSLYYEEKKEYPESLSDLGLNNLIYKDPKTGKPYEYHRLNNGRGYEICIQFEKEGRKCFSSNDWSTNLPSPDRSLTSVEKRDRRRLSDLDLISSMLLQYRLKNGNYPVSLLTVKLNEDNEVVREIKSANYGRDIPVDPKDPEYYYGYKSTGDWFELTARLENVDNPNCDPGIKKKRNICIFFLKHY